MDLFQLFQRFITIDRIRLTVISLFLYRERGKPLEHLEHWNKLVENGSRSTTYGCSKTQITLEQLEQTGVSERDSGFVGRYLRFVGHDLRSFIRFLGCFLRFFALLRSFLTAFRTKLLMQRLTRLLFDDSGTPTEMIVNTA